MTRVRRDTHLPYYTENPRKNLHLLGKLTFPSNAGALLGKVVILTELLSLTTHYGAFASQCTDFFHFYNFQRLFSVFLTFI